MADGTPMEVVSVVPDESGASVAGADEPLSEADAAMLRASCGACRLLGLDEYEFSMVLGQLQQRTGLGRVMAAQLLAIAEGFVDAAVDLFLSNHDSLAAHVVEPAVAARLVAQSRACLKRAQPGDPPLCPSHGVVWRDPACHTDGTITRTPAGDILTVHPEGEGIIRRVHLCTRVHMRRTDVWQEWPQVFGIAGAPFTLGLNLAETLAFINPSRDWAL